MNHTISSLLLQTCSLLISPPVVLGASLLSSAHLCSQEYYEDRPVEKIDVQLQTSEPERFFDPHAVLSKLQTQTGKPFSQFTFDQDLKALSEEYERIDPRMELREGKLYITLYITPKPLIHAIEWKGNQKIGTSTLQKELDIEPLTYFNRHAFHKALNKIKELYLKRGYFESQVSYSLQPIPNTPQVDILIEVKEGRPGHIEKISFSGFSKEEEKELREQIYLKKYHFLTSWLTGTGNFRDEALEQDRVTILNYLQNKGYADARVHIQLLDDPLSGRLIIEITCVKGQIYRFGTQSFRGYSLLSLEELEAKSQISPEAPFSPDKIRDTAQAIKDFYGHKGYIEASVQYEMQLREDEPIFDVVFFIDEGQQYKIGMIHVLGNSSTLCNVILRESLLCPGDVFDSRKLKATQTRLEAVGYFKSVNVYAVKSADSEELGDNYRDVYIEIEEMSTGNVSLFLGFSSMDDVFGGLDLTEKNFHIAGLGRALKGQLSALRGGGEFFHTRGTVGKKQNNILISWMNPYINDTLWRLGVELSRSYSHNLQKNVTVVTYGGAVTASYPLSSYWSTGVRQRVRHSKDTLDLDPAGSSAEAIASATYYEKLLAQKGLVSAFSGNVSYDSVDSAYKPHRGWRSYLEAEVAGLGGSYRFLKGSYLNTIYIPLYSSGTLKLRGDFRYIFPFGDRNQEIPYSERLFMGGENTVRGYKPFLLGPIIELTDDHGKKIPTETPFGGLSSSLLSLEFNQELFPVADLFAFFDVGSLNFNRLDLNNWRPSTGVGIRLDIGNRTPIMVGWGFPLVKKDRDEGKWQKVFFSMGGQF